MCPVCMTTTLAWVTASVTSIGGVSALVVSRIRNKNGIHGEQASEQEEQAPQESSGGAR